MRYIILIFLLFFNFSYVNADAIYNLIKIPNLEVHKVDDVNGIKYLVSKRGFVIGDTNNIKCNGINNSDLDREFNTIQNNLRDYNSNFLRKINLKFVVLCKNLEISGINTGGIPDNKFRTLILDLTFNQNYFERMIHHEIFHMIDNSFPELFEKNKWSELNNKDFSYAECSTCTDLLGLDLEITKGFLTEYSMSTAEEDMAEIYSLLKTNFKEIDLLIKKDNILTKKKNFLINGLKEVECGNVLIELDPKIAPKAVNRFKKLINRGSYNGSTFYRVIENTLIQAGDIEYGNVSNLNYSKVGTGKSGLGTIKSELSGNFLFNAGSVAFARKDQFDTEDSEFFITLIDIPIYQGEYTPIGRVIAGMDSLKKIKAGNKSTYVLKPDYIKNIKLLVN